ncbi:MAG: MarR family transcriptional regulator [Rhodothermales bacterium]|nr:MarR family transcriptional regulator [Rhodothermales bacterium]
MSPTLTERLKQRRFESPAQEALLGVMVTNSWVMGELTSAMSSFGVTPAQYNVLRILRGSHPDALTCSEVGLRLIDRTPDVTRLLGRLEKNGYTTRERASYDRRVVEVRITDKGLELLETMDPEVERITNDLTDGLTPAEHVQLSRLLDKLRKPH